MEKLVIIIRKNRIRKLVTQPKERFGVGSIDIISFSDIVNTISVFKRY